MALAALVGLPAALPAAVTIGTTNGLGADTYLGNDSNEPGPGVIRGTNAGFAHRVFAGTRMKILYIRFDKGTNLINYAGSTIGINFTSANRTRTCTVYGLKDGDPGEAWPENGTCYTNAPGVIYTNGTPLAQFPTIDTNRMVLLGTMPNFNAATGWQTSDPNTLNLSSFLQADTDGLVTFLFLTTSDNSQSYFGTTKESGPDLGPVLNMPNAVIDPGLSNLTWVVGNGSWDFVANNWNDGSGNVAYQEVNTIGNRVQFDDTASGASPIVVTLDTTVTPRSITNNSAKNFIITGTGSGAINGGTGLTKLGLGTLTLSNVLNSFEGPVRIFQGTVAFSSGALGGLTSSLLIDGGTLAYAAGNVDDISGRVVTFGANGATIDDGGNSVFFNAPVGGVSTGGFTKTGAGTLALNGAHTYTGPTTVAAGILSLGGLASLASPQIIINSAATLDTWALGSLVLNGAINQQLSGSGTNAGGITVAAGTTLSPGNNVGQLTITGDLTISGGTNVLDVSTLAGGTDSLVVDGVIYINSGWVRLVPGTLLTNGVYKLIKYTGGLIGSAGTLLIDGFSQPGQVAFLDDSTPGEINLLVVTASSDNLVWAGDGSANLWNVGGAANWVNGGPDVFNHGDSVTFNSVGAANGTVNLTQAVIPGGITVDATTDYVFTDGTFVGGGKISGTTGIIKNNTGKLTVQSVNNNSGTTVINGGTIEVGFGGVDGHLGSGSIQNNGALVFNQLVSRTIPSITGSGSLAQLGATTLTVAGTTSYSGATTIGSGATLALGDGGALTLTTSGIANDGTFVLNTSAGQTLPTITGAGSFTKQGTGALAINAAPGYTGNTTIAGGTTTLGVANAIPSGLRVETGATLDINGFNQTVTSLASVNFAGGTIVNNGNSVTNTLTVNNATDSDSSIAINNGTSGVIALVKKGTGALLLRGNSTYSGGTVVEEGALDYRADPALGTGLVVMSNATTFNAGGNGVFPGVNFFIPAGATVNFNSAALGNGMGGNFSSGDATSVLNLVGSLSWGVENGKQFQAFTGTVLVDAAATLRFSSTGLDENGGDNTTFEVNGILQSRNGATLGIALGALTGTGFINGPQAGGAPGTTPYVIGAKGLDAVFNGTINGDTLATANSIIKVGSGTQTLAGTNLYAGSTIVSNGVLAFLGVDATPTNTVVVNATAPGVLDMSGLPGSTLVLGLTTNNQTLTGNGNITGTILVDTASGNIVTVNPGNGIGTLTISGGLTLAVNSVVNMELNRSVTPNADRLSAASIAPNGATLNIVNAGATLLAGATFQLFDGAVTGFGAVNLPATDASGQIAYTWQNNLAVDGSITLLTGLNPNPTPISSVVNGGNLELSWPADRTGWTLQAQTNSLAVGLANNWANVAGSTTTNQVIVPINPANPTVFYRLTLPLP
jgi:fibronectin-binding autotransporter adhesin